jgi:hypothetical protein
MRAFLKWVAHGAMVFLPRYVAFLSVLQECFRGEIFRERREKALD